MNTMRHIRLSVAAVLLAVCIASVSSDELPLRRVTIFTSGVAEFVHEGRLTGEEAIVLPVPEAHMSDVIRSLSVIDSGGGEVRSISYPAGESLSDRLSRFRIDLEHVTSIEALLNRARGTTIRVVLADGRTFEGRVVGADRPNAERSSTLLLRETAGLRSIDIEEVAEFFLGDAALQRDLDRALEVLETSTVGTDIRTIRLDLAGGASRTVQIRYLREMPVWKTSYRAVVDGERVLLQGWAHLDNTGTVDWDGVEVHLVSASPETYWIDLYPPHYVGRAAVQGRTSVQESLSPSPGVTLERSAAERSRLDDGFAQNFEEQSMTNLNLATRESAEERRSRSGTSFVLTDPVTLPRGESAMVPLINRSFPVEITRSFNPLRDIDGPRLSVSFENDSPLQLPAGPVTIYEGDRYAGDSSLAILLPGGSATLPYAADLELTVEREMQPITEELETIRVVDGLLVTERRARIGTTYRIEPTGEAPRPFPSVRIAHPARPGWELISPSPVERSAEVMTIESAGREVVVVEEQIREQRYALGSMARDALVTFSSNRLIVPRVRRILQNVLQLRDELVEKERERQELEREEGAIFRDQARIRENMANLDRDSRLYLRYVADLSAQETMLENLEEDLRLAREAEEAARTALEGYLRSLDS